jgi:hypothetical protein
MSTVDTRLQAFWTHAKAFHLTGGDVWLVFIENIQSNGTGTAQAAATRFLFRLKLKVTNVADSS